MYKNLFQVPGFHELVANLENSNKVVLQTKTRRDFATRNNERKSNEQKGEIYV